MTEPQPRYEPLTPIESERQVRWVANALTRAQAELRDARDDEVTRKHEYERLRRRALLSPDRPRVERGGLTTAERDAWVEEECADAREVYELAEAKRKAAEEHLRTLREQGMLAATLAKSVHLAYSVAGTHG